MKLRLRKTDKKAVGSMVLSAANQRLTQAQLAELCACSHANLVGHIGNIYEDEELQEGSTCRKFRQVQLEEVGRICSVSDMKQIKIADNNGRGHETFLREYRTV